MTDYVNWCFSGGAPGADLQWGVCAAEHGHGVRHYSFAGHNSGANESQLIRLTEKQLKQADEFCQRANKTLCRRFPTRSPHSTNLLRRDWFQVREAEVCYGVGTFGLRPDTNVSVGATVRGRVSGGTAWAIQMFIDRHNGDQCSCYFFDQTLCRWFAWNDGWLAIYAPPVPSGAYAGIGTRDLSSIGRMAICTAYDDRTT
jgi:hypothetical protein